MTALVKLTSLGGTSYPWNSPQTYAFGASAVVLLVASDDVGHAADDGRGLTTSVTIQTVFLVAVPIAAVSFVLTWLLPEIRLRHTVGDAHPETA